MKSYQSSFLVSSAVILIFLAASVRAQNLSLPKGKSIFITGVTFDGTTKEPLALANFSINRAKFSSTSESGRFSFYAFSRDTIEFTYLGYQPCQVIIPDSLSSDEYVMGVFMHEKSTQLAEIIIVKRQNSSSMIIKPVQSDQRATVLAQNNVDKAVIEGLTKSPQVYDAEMNARKMMKINQLRSEWKGMLVTPENSLGISTLGYKTFNVIYDGPIIYTDKTTKELISNSESTLLLSYFDTLIKQKPNLLIIPENSPLK
jgi:hypothetical protein